MSVVSPPSAPSTHQVSVWPGRNQAQAMADAMMLVSAHRTGLRRRLRVRGDVLVSEGWSGRRLILEWVAPIAELEAEPTTFRFENGKVGVMLSCRHEAGACWRIEEYDGQPKLADLIRLRASPEVAQELADALRDLVMSLQQPSTTQ